MLATLVAIALVFTGAAMTQTKQTQSKTGVSTQGKAPSGPSPKTVTISCQNGVITVNPPRVEIKHDTEEVVWTDNNKCPGWKVIFDKPEGSPFKPKDTFNGPSPANHSGLATVPPHKFGYRYTVKVPRLPDLDPDVIIKG
jgi:hypothetical protein